MFENYKLKKVTRNLGTIEETKNAIVCNVDGQKLSGIYTDGLIILDTRKLKEKYGVDKDILFKIKNYNFKQGLFLITDASITFNKCNFYDDIYIKTINDVVFDDNSYINSTDTYKHSDRFMEIDHANKVIFMNEVIGNYVSDNEVSMKINADEIEIYNSSILNDKISSANLQSNSIKIDNSIISGYSSFIKAPHLLIDDASVINPQRSLIIDTNTELDEEAISSEQIIINGIKTYPTIEDIKRTHVLKK